MFGSPGTSAGWRQARPSRGFTPPRTQAPEVLHTHLELARARQRRISKPGAREDSKQLVRGVGSAAGSVRRRGAPERSECGPAGNSLSRSLGPRSLLRGPPGPSASFPRTAISK
ncbi:hypothetical protein NN561_009496 [Cricetulus griseus]